MGRHKTVVAAWGETSPAWGMRYRCEWGEVVGGRVRRLRQKEGLTLSGLAASFYRADGGHYSPGFISRLERGWASPPLWIYVVLAERFGLPPGRLLGPEDADRQLDEGEMTLVRLLRRLGVAPEEAIERVVTPTGVAAAPRAYG